MQAFGRTSSKTCSSQLELQKEHRRGSLLQKDEVQSGTEGEAGPVGQHHRCPSAAHLSGPAFKQLPVTLELPGAGVLGGISVMLLVKVLRVSALLLLLLYLHPAGGHGGREPGSQGLEAGQLD